MRHRTTFALLVLFFASLGALWWAEHADIPTAAERRERSNRLLPELIDVKPEGVLRVDVESRARELRLSVVRRGPGVWQLREPIDGSADPNLVETLVRNLKELRKSIDAGTIEGDPAPYGLDVPRATLKLYGVDAKRPLAVLDVGNTTRERIYVRPIGGRGIEVVDARLLGAVGKPPIEWRDRTLLRVPSFRVEGLTIAESQPPRQTVLQREDRKWRILSPFSAPADDDKVEGLSAELAATRVVDGSDGFVADDVQALAPYGLDKPYLSVTVRPFPGSGPPQVLHIGNSVPGHPDQRYAVKGDQDDVVRVDTKLLREAFPGPVALRSRTLIDVARGRISEVRVESSGLGVEFDLHRRAEGWALSKPEHGEADSPAVERLLERLIGLQASEFLDPAAVSDPKLDPPVNRIRIWQREAGRSPTPKDGSASRPDGQSAGDPAGQPRVDLRLGRHDALKRTVYAQVAGDTTILAVPDTILDVLPRNRFAFRDQTVLDLKVTDIDRLTIERGDRTVTVQAPSSGSSALDWRMVEPVQAATDTQAVTALVTTLARLRAESWESEQVGDGRAFGLDAPRIRVRWATRANPSSDGRSQSAATSERVLRLGRPKPSGGAIYANLEGEPTVFTLSAGVASLFESELHSREIMKFSLDKVRRLTIQWPTRGLALSRPSDTSGGSEWRIEPGYDPSGVDLSRVGDAVKFLSTLQTPKYFQYSGGFPDLSGIEPSLVTIAVGVEGRKEPWVLRVGRVLTETQALGTNTTGSSGPVFIVPLVEGLGELVREPPRFGDLPADVFAPGSTTAPGP